MADTPLTASDYPIAETQPDEVIGNRGKALSSLTMEAVLSGDISMEDLRITPRALEQQAQISESVGRSTLARNFERAAEMAQIPQDEVMAIYELLRPGRAASKDSLLDMAQKLRDELNAPLLADFIAEASRFYEMRGLFQKRY
jgi:propanediol dehydratase small subunit